MSPLFDADPYGLCESSDPPLRFRVELNNDLPTFLSHPLNMTRSLSSEGSAYEAAEALEGVARHELPGDAVPGST